MKCPKCNGQGGWRVEVWSNLAQQMYSWKRCPDCKGTGVKADKKR